MSTSSALRKTIVGLSFLVLAPVAALAQTSPNKQPPRLPPNESQSSQIPAGVDTGSPTTSDHLPLGTPNPTDASADQVYQRTNSAAARAAARPDPLTRTGAPLPTAAPLVGAAVMKDASRPAGQPLSQGTANPRLACAYNQDPSFRNAMSRCTGLTDRSARSECVNRMMEARRETPVALPDSGFVGSSASPREAMNLGVGGARGCV